MIITVDSTALALLINPDARPPIDPATGNPLEYARERVVALIEGMTTSDTLIVPTPVLAEVLVEAGEGGPEILERLQTYARIRVEPFDQRAAVETAQMTREAIQSGVGKRGGSPQPWQKVKFDRQIIAIARVHRSDAIYSDDGNLATFAQSVGSNVVSTWELAVPDNSGDLFEALNNNPEGEDRPS